eukprot:TRINITY_DN64038_c0_g2_i2.p2 TRINITY_DN64038_c0_g2~~TRINITY_DN64038_c0_g2_i2.p2  ORF type:complete len:151 (-),score=28.73 TRINITY_DN64038_c0_g2_i2:991-1443(-)
MDADDPEFVPQPDHSVGETSTVSTASESGSGDDDDAQPKVKFWIPMQATRRGIPISTKLNTQLQPLSTAHSHSSIQPTPLSPSSPNMTLDVPSPASTSSSSSHTSAFHPVGENVGKGVVGITPSREALATPPVLVLSRSMVGNSGAANGP